MLRLTKDKFPEPCVSSSMCAFVSCVFVTGQHILCTNTTHTIQRIEHAWNSESHSTEFTTVLYTYGVRVTSVWTRTDTCDFSEAIFHLIQYLWLLLELFRLYWLCYFSCWLQPSLLSKRMREGQCKWRKRQISINICSHVYFTNNTLKELTNILCIERKNTRTSPMLRTRARSLNYTTTFASLASAMCVCVWVNIIIASTSPASLSLRAFRIRMCCADTIAQYTLLESLHACGSHVGCVRLLSLQFGLRNHIHTHISSSTSSA